jgi:SAM-dependent methyltransferase
MTDDWNDYADGWDENTDVNHYADLALASLVEQTNIRAAGWKSKRILDFGCGTGTMAEKVAPYVHEVVAVDTSDKMVAVLKDKGIGNLVALHLDILADDFPDQENWQSSFDLIYASSVCGFLPNYENAVITLGGFLKGGGRFVQWDWLATGETDAGLTEAQVRNALSAAQFNSVSVKQAFTMKTDEQTMPVLTGAGVR